MEPSENYPTSSSMSRQDDAHLQDGQKGLPLVPVRLEKAETGNALLKASASESCNGFETEDAILYIKFELASR